MLKKSLTVFFIVLSVSALYAGTIPGEVLRSFDQSEGNVFESGGRVYVSVGDTFDSTVSLAEASRKLKAEAVDAILRYKGSVATVMLNSEQVFGATPEGQYLFTRSRTERASGYVSDFRVETNSAAFDNGLKVRQIVSAVYLPVQGTRDPDFGLGAKLDKRVYTEGEPAVLSAKLAKAGYLYVFDIDAEGNCYPLFPNAYDTNNSIRPGTFAFPTPRMREYTSALVMTLPEGAAETVEFFLVMVTDKPFPAGDVTTYDELIGRIARIDRDKIEFVTVGYKIAAR